MSQKIQTELQKYPHDIASAEIAGMFINIRLTDSAFLQMLTALQKTQHEPKPHADETVIVDYIGINIGKPLHIGHLCTPSIGQVFCNIYRHLGYKVIGDVHTGDWGGIFGRLIA